MRFAIKKVLEAEIIFMLLCMKVKRKEQRKMKGTIICYGDSNTYGYDPQSLTGGRYPENIRWTGILQEKSGWLIKNHGVNGRCIPHNSSQIHFFCEQLRDWCKIKGTVRIWIMLGTNDLLTEKGFTAEDTGNRMKKFLQVLVQQQEINNREMKVRLIAPPPVKRGAWVDEERICREAEKLDKIYSKVAEELNMDFTGTGDWEIPVAYDGVHFSQEGHRKFADKLLEILYNKPE